MSQNAAPSAYTTVGGEGILAVVSAAGTVSIISARTLAKIRSVSLFQGVASSSSASSTRRRIIALTFVSGFRHAGDQMTTSGGSSVCLHVVDNCGTYYTICTKTFVVCVASISVLNGAAANTKADKIISQAAWTLVAEQAHDGKMGGADTSELCLACVSPSHGVTMTEVRSLLPPTKKASAHNASPMLIFAPVTATDSLVLSTSLTTGIVTIAEIGRRWVVAVQLSLSSDSNAAGDVVTHLKAGAPSNFLVPCDVHTLASHPSLATGGVAVGGRRGEVCLVTNSLSSNPITFSDHWHFGPLSALTFTADGKTLLSGGSEQVLVSWSAGGSFGRSSVTRVFSAEGAGVAGSGEWSSASPMVGVLSLGLTSISCGSSNHKASVWGSTADSTSAYSVGSTSSSPVLILFGDSSLAAVDPLEHRTLATASGAQWSVPLATSSLPSAQQLVWKGRDAVMMCVGDCVRFCDPSTNEALHSVVARFRPEASAVGLNGPAAPTALMAASTRDGKLLFTFENLDPVGLPSVLKVWEYQVPANRAQGGALPQAGRHVLIQTIVAPHGTSSRDMVGLRVDEGPARLRLFTADRGSIKCWAPTIVAAHEIATTSSVSAAALGKTTVWGAVGTSLFPSHRLSDFAISVDGSVCVAADDTVHFLAVAAAAAPSEEVEEVKDRSSTFALKEAREWTRVLHLAQTHTTSTLNNLDIAALGGGDGGSSAPKVVARSQDGQFVFVWTLNVTSGVWDYLAVPTPKPTSQFSAVTVVTDSTSTRIVSLIADRQPSRLATVSSSSQVNRVFELVAKKGKVAGYTLAASKTPGVITACDVVLGALTSSKSLFVADGLGLQLVSVDAGAQSDVMVPRQQEKPSGLSSFFHTPAPVAPIAELTVSPEAKDQQPALLAALGVLGAEAYTCPAVSTVLSALLNA